MASHLREILGKHLNEQKVEMREDETQIHPYEMCMRGNPFPEWKSNAYR
jgi:hypothetical protein